MSTKPPFMVDSGFSHENICHGFFTRQGGASTGAFASLNGNPWSGDEPCNVEENLRRVRDALSVPNAYCLICRQTHSTIVVSADRAWSFQQAPRADAMIARSDSLCLCLMTADCAPVLLHDPIASVIGAVHAGWRGALAGVLNSVVAAMEELGAQPAAQRATRFSSPSPRF